MPEQPYTPFKYTTPKGETWTHIHYNAMAVQVAEQQGWELVWRNYTPEEEVEEANEYMMEPGGNAACPIYGVLARIPAGELCPLWWYPDPEPTGRVVRSETLREFEENERRYAAENANG